VLWQWKKRYFVLRKPSGSLPDQYELHYYKDQRCSTKKGSIDLEQCEQIIEALDSDAFPYLLAIKTYYKNKVRTYYLAADTEQEMNQWVQWLCHVCGLKPEDQPTDIPDPKPVTQPPGVVRQSSNIGASQAISNGRPPSPQQLTPIATTVVPLLSASPHGGAGFQSAGPQPVARTVSDSSLCYIPLENCTTGQPLPVDRRESVESVPDFEAPAPPQKLYGHHNIAMQILEDDVFTPGIYDHPPAQRQPESSSHREVSDLYKVPPVKLLHGKKLASDDDGRDLSYDVPPTRGLSPRASMATDSRSSVGGSDQSIPSKECYDYPPPRRDVAASLDNEAPPARPPKPSHLQSPYQNLSPTGNILSDTNLMSTVPAPPKAHSARVTPGYDIPRSSTLHLSRNLQSGMSHVGTVPPRPTRYVPTNPSTHAYLNTHNKPGSSELRLASKGASDGDQSSDHSDLSLVPPIVSIPQTDLTGDPRDVRSSSPSIYQFPPSSSTSSTSLEAPVRPPARTTPQAPSVSPRSQDSSTASSQGQDDSTSVIFSTQRTRSFKRNHNVNNSSPKPSPKLSTAQMSVPVPAPRPVLPTRPKEISTSDEDEETRQHEQEEQTHHPLSLLRAVPAPSVDNDRELKYIDLALPEASQEPPRSSHTHGHGHTHSHSHNHTERGKESATEYREIDFVKTQALNDTKRVKEKERKNDDHN
jgi:hypothetical protein